MSISISELKYDVSAGVVVFLLALPLSQGVALASGAPLLSGIISGIIWGPDWGSLSGSKTTFFHIIRGAIKNGAKAKYFFGILLFINL